MFCQGGLFCETYMKLFIEKSNTDMYRKGKWVYIISKCDSEICPVQNLKIYLECDGIFNSDYDSYLFMSYLWKQRKINLIVFTPLSFTRTREILLKALQSIRLEKKDFRLHSLRSGGETAPANAGVPDRLFKRHGRWESDKAKDRYVEDDVQHLLLVSRNLGL